MQIPNQTEEVATEIHDKISHEPTATPTSTTLKMYSFVPKWALMGPVSIFTSVTLFLHYLGLISSNHLLPLASVLFATLYVPTAHARLAHLLETPNGFLTAQDFTTQKLHHGASLVVLCRLFHWLGLLSLLPAPGTFAGTYLYIFALDVLALSFIMPGFLTAAQEAYRNGDTCAEDELQLGCGVAMFFICGCEAGSAAFGYGMCLAVLGVGMCLAVVFGLLCVLAMVLLPLAFDFGNLVRRQITVARGWWCKHCKEFKKRIRTREAC